MDEKRAGPYRDWCYELYEKMKRYETTRNEPQAQEASTMKAFMWIAWKLDEDKKRTEMVGGEEKLWMVVAADKAEAERKADFALAKELNLKSADELAGYEVQCCPFGG